jgi:hypothetical protein
MTTCPKDGYFPQICVKKSCNTASIPAIFCLVLRKNLSLFVKFLFYKQGLVLLISFHPSTKSAEWFSRRLRRQNHPACFCKVANIQKIKAGQSNKIGAQTAAVPPVFFSSFSRFPNNLAN